MKLRKASTSSAVTGRILSAEEVRALLDVRSCARPRPEQFPRKEQIDVQELVRRITALIEELNLNRG